MKDYIKTLLMKILSYIMLLVGILIMVITLILVIPFMAIVIGILFILYILFTILQVITSPIIGMSYVFKSLLRREKNETIHNEKQR